MSTKMSVVHTPEEVSRRLGGISVATLISLLKAKGYPWTELKPGGTPWGRGRQTWGLTDDQIAVVIAGQSRTFAATDAPDSPGTAELPKGDARLTSLGHDGKSRLRRGRVARA